MPARCSSATPSIQSSPRLQSKDPAAISGWLAFPVARAATVLRTMVPDSIVYRPHDEAPSRISFLTTALPTSAGTVRPGLPVRRFEYVSRGDFVPGRLCAPEPSASAPRPLVLLLNGASQTANADPFTDAVDWVHRGLAVATVDLPLHGQRSSPKLSARLHRGLGGLMRGEALDPDTRALVEEFARQSTSDTIRGLDALSALPELDAKRIALVGLGVGALVGAYALAHDVRPRACVFAGGVGRFRDVALDPALHLAQRVAPEPCPTLVIDHPTDPAAAPARGFFDAIAEPRTWAEAPAETDGEHTLSAALPAAMAEQIADFLAKHLSS